MSISLSSPRLSPVGFVWRVVAVHVVTYFVVGLVAFVVVDYRALFATTELRLLMRPTTSAWVAAGPALQIVRGLVFGLVLWPLRERLLGRHGAAVLFGLFFGFAILGAAGPAPGSLEGFFFTTIPPSVQLLGMPEVIVQTALFSALVVPWWRNSARWPHVVAAVAVVVVLAFSGLGVLDAAGLLPSAPATGSASQP